MTGIVRSAEIPKMTSPSWQGHRDLPTTGPAIFRVLRQKEEYRNRRSCDGKHIGMTDSRLL